MQWGKVHNSLMGGEDRRVAGRTARGDSRSVAEADRVAGAEAVASASSTRTWPVVVAGGLKRVRCRSSPGGLTASDTSYLSCGGIGAAAVSGSARLARRTSARSPRYRVARLFPRATPV